MEDATTTTMALSGDRVGAANPNPDCGHKEWTLGCAICFDEMFKVAKIGLGVEEIARMSKVDGALIYNWYVLTVLTGLERQLVPRTNSIDLKMSGLARDLLANIHQLMDHFSSVISDPQRLATVMITSEASLMAVRQQRDEAKAAEAAGEEPPKKSSIILTD